MHTKQELNWQTILQQVDVLQPEFAALQQSAKPCVALFGAGSVGHDALQYFLAKQFTVRCFIDNSPQKQGTVIQGIPVVSIQDDLVASADLILITAKTVVNEVRLQLQQLKYRFMAFNAYFVLDNLDRYAWVRNEILHDPMSVQTLDGLMMAMLTNSNAYCASVMDYNQYFCLPHFLNTDDYFVDAGAFVGDTAEKFIWANTGMFKHLYLFEPGPRQLAALQHRMNRLIAEWALERDKISIVNAGLADQDGRASFASNQIKPAASTFSGHHMLNADTLQDVVIWSLDSYFAAHPSPVTFIKADTEGMELALLDGAARTITNNKPKMALSTYHRIGDLFAIIEKVKKLVPDYHVALRHHSPNLAETVLYFWVDSDI